MYMVMAFGVNIPLYEIMLLFIVLLTAGLVFMLIELKKLNDYLVIERNDLQRLERDLSMLEDTEKKLSGSNQRPVPVQQIQRPVSAQPVPQQKTGL
jgi:hypothetical protein